MRFRIGTIFYVMALLAAALATFGGSGIVHGTFPPPYLADENGKPIHSWRTLILPNMELHDLYQAYSFDEPWDGPNNRKLARSLSGGLPEYCCPGARSPELPNETHFFAVVGPKAMWPREQGVKPDDITDGAKWTLHVIEVHGLGVDWMEPRDILFDEAIELLGQTIESPSLGHVKDDRFFYRVPGNFRCIAFADGHVRGLGRIGDRDVAEALLTVASGDGIDEGVLDDWLPASRQIKWGHVYSFSVFVLLALLPLRWMFVRREKEAYGENE